MHAQVLEGIASLRPAGFTDEDADDAAEAAYPAGTEETAGTGQHPVTDPAGPAAPPGPAGPVGSALAATIVARMDPRTTLGVGDRARVHMDLAALHFFDPATGASLRG